MTESLSREFVADLEVRADVSGRTIHGIIVPFEQVARVSDGGRPYDEMFARGSFAKTIAERGDRVKLLSQHNSRTNPLGRATLLREDAAGVYGEFHVSRTAAGDEVLELVRDGALDSFSVGFTPIKHRKQGTTTVRTEVGLRETSLVTFPAYASAMVGGVRWDALSDDDRAELLRAIGEHFDLRPTSPRMDPEVISTSPEAAAAEQEPPAHSAKQTKFTFAAAVRQKGIL